MSPTTLVFDNRRSQTDLIDLPILVKLDLRRLNYEDIVDAARDLSFRDPVTDRELEFEVEKWNPSGESYVWVRVPKITARSSNERITMHFGANARRGPSEPTAVWPGYQLVVHGTGRSLEVDNSADSSIKGDANSMPTLGPGEIGDAILFTGTTEVAFTNSGPLLDRWGAFTLEYWLYCDYESASLPSATEPQIFHKPDGARLGRIRTLAGVTEAFIHQIDFAFTSSIEFPSTLVLPRVWTHVVFTFDGQLLRLYRDAAIADIIRVSTANTTTTAGSGLLYLGAPLASLTGMLDELRIANRALTGDELDAQHRASVGTFITFL